MSITAEVVKQALKQVIDENMATDYISAGCLRDLRIVQNNISLVIELGYPAKSLFDGIKQKIVAILQTIDGIGKVDVHVCSKIKTHAIKRATKPIEGIKNIIAISSGKGGVGKSTVTANLALALSAEGAKVGILDADIYGPSQPTLMGVSQKPQCSDGEHMDPVEKCGIELMSIGFMMDDVQPLVWRAPMATQGVMQLLEMTKWNDLDYLLIDMPPGTGDIQMTLSQKAPVTGAVVVTTPQEVAVLDARKGLMMFQKMSVDILGVVENMSTYLCPHCGQIEHIFGQDGAKNICKVYGVDSLGEVPLNMNVCSQTDKGLPIVASDPEGIVAKIFIGIAHRLGACVALRPIDMAGKIPEVVSV